ncbi:ORF127 lef6 [Spodoptera exigua multiple nucleopolyhedrovirus]|uniref:ORF127 lef6 n=1 Tax=Spodoptera exigua nuclear polyhedrosis virus (strain US) TaxID=31506 RepID=Q9J813_NPVSE|nr:ORF127 lef6 [Spodoptera exigua multiple nucleopolyhedrovirus]AAF33656.1 ORF127 lef6 [Spodoptera exigua multiple nucleopolyhedrovirus]
MYVFYINGSHVEKRFGREFINFICGGKIKHDIEPEQCTRKRVVVKSSYAAKKLLAANGRAFWPDGTKFRCKQLNNHHQHHHHLYRRRRDGIKTSSSLHHRGGDGNSVNDDELCCDRRQSSPAFSEDWYNSTAFIDINFDDDINNDNDKSYYNNDTVQNLNMRI